MGYSRLMGANEVGTLAALKAHRAEPIDAAIAEHGGRIVKLTGDGMVGWMQVDPDIAPLRADARGRALLGLAE